MKKILPIILAVIAFLVVWFLLAPPPQSTIAVASKDLSVGQIITFEDVELRSLPEEVIPLDAVRNVNELIGMTLLIDRAQGDVVQFSQVGEEMIALQPNERALAVTVNNASGFAGLLIPGNRVGLTAIIQQQAKGGEGTYSKAAIEDLRLLYLSPEFKALDPDALDPVEDQETGAVYVQDRETKGVVILAVPIDAHTIIYDFSKVDPEISTKSRVVYVLELLAALESSSNSELFLYLMPRNATEMVTSGLWLQDVVVFARTPTATISLIDVLGLETPVPAGE